MNRSNVAAPAALGALGIALAALGIISLLLDITLYLSWVAPAVTIAGLVLVTLALLWMVLAQAGGPRRERARRAAPLHTLDPAIHVPNRERLLAALQALESETLNLIDLRREIHRLNTQQWSYVHRNETDEEVEATRRYRTARRDVAQATQDWPDELQAPVDRFCNAMEKFLVTEVYGDPGDQEIHQDISEYTRWTVRQIDEIASGSYGAGQDPSSGPSQAP